MASETKTRYVAFVFLALPLTLGCGEGMNVGERGNAATPSTGPSSTGVGNTTTSGGTSATAPGGGFGTTPMGAGAAAPTGQPIDPNDPANQPIPETPTEPEHELETSFRAPIATGRFVWSANPSSGRVALIDAQTLQVQVLSAGFGPTYLAAVPDPNGEVNSAVVLNVLGQDATLFRVGSDQTVTSTSFATHAGANRWQVSRSGTWGIAWTDAREFENPDPTDGFQDVTVARFGDPTQATRLTVGYRPSALAFDSAEERAYAVTEPGISVIDLSGDEPEVTELFEVGGGVLASDIPRDVVITPDGEHALVRIEDESAITLLSLRDGERTDVPLGAAVSDLDLSQDGTCAVAVVRDLRQAVVLPVPEIFDDPSGYDTVEVPTEAFGSVALSPDGNAILLFTNAVDSDRITIVDGRPGDAYLSYRTVSVNGAVRAVFTAEDGEHAIALITPGADSTKKGAFSIVPTLAERSPKLVGTDATPVSVALVPQVPTDRGLITVRDDASGIYGVYLVRMPSLQVDFVDIASPPLSTGIVTDTRKGYVAQEHAEGRITFLSLEEGDAQTLTGFELAVKVVD